MEHHDASGPPVDRARGDLPIAAPGALEPELSARALTWATFVLVFALEAACIHRYAPRVPLFDDYEMVPSYTGERPLTVEWLWSLSNEHRVFLPRLVHIINFRLSGGDFRASNLVSLAFLSAAAASLIEVARRRRGYQRFTDAFFPLILLNPAHLQNLIWAWELVHVAPPAIACLLLGFIVTRTGWPTAKQAAPFALGLFLLPLLSGTGLIMAPALVVWLLIGAVAWWRSGSKLQGILLLLLGLPTIGLVGLYFKGYVRPSYIPDRGTPYESLRTFAEFFIIGLGPAIRAFKQAFGLPTLGILGLGGLISAWAFLARPAERARSLGLLAFLASWTGLALAVGVNRSGFGPAAGLAERYVTPAAPILCWAYFAWELYGPSFTRRLVPVGLSLAALLLFLPNLQESRSMGSSVSDRFGEFESDVRKESYVYQVAKRHGMLILGSEDPSSYLDALRRAGIRPFDRLRKNPEFREVTLPVAPSDVEHATWDASTKTIQVEGRDSRVTFALPEPIQVAGIRMNYSLEGPPGSGNRFIISWKAAEKDAYSKERSLQDYSVRMLTGRDLSTTFWVDDMVGEFRIEPEERRCKLQVHSLTLLIP